MTRWQRGSGRGTDASGKVQSARVMASTNPWRELKSSLSNTVPGWVRFYGTLTTIDELCLSRGKQGGLSGGGFRPLGSSKRKF
jgi:hypothetical protein